MPGSATNGGRIAGKTPGPQGTGRKVRGRITNGITQRRGHACPSANETDSTPIGARHSLNMGAQPCLCKGVFPQKHSLRGKLPDRFEAARKHAQSSSPSSQSASTGGASSAKTSEKLACARFTSIFNKAS